MSPRDVRVLVLGAGSIGARHARNLAAAGASVAIADPDPQRAASVDAAENVPFDLDRLAGYDGIVVASPTTFHRTQTEAALAAGARVLVEKPLALLDDSIESLLAASDRIMVGYNLRFHEPNQQLVELVRVGRAGAVSSIRVWFGSWLPDWRPSVDYRQSYSARADLGGGVLLDAIHELDLLVWLVGDADFDIIGSVVERRGPLEIDVEDTVKALLRHTGGAVADVSLDYLSRRYRRGVEIVGDEATLRLDWARGVIEIEDRARVDAGSIDVSVDASYVREAAHFLAFVRDGVPPPVDGTTGAASLELARRIRAAAR
jgi:predicted dehydrogenase